MLRQFSTRRITISFLLDWFGTLGTMLLAVYLRVRIGFLPDQFLGLLDRLHIPVMNWWEGMRPEQIFAFPVLVLISLIWPFFFISHSPAQTNKAFRSLSSLFGKLLLMAGITYLFQVTFTYSFFLLYPGFGTLLYKSGIIFSVLLAVGLFPDERTTLKDPKFQLGLILGLAGMVITIVGDKDFGEMQFNLGVIMVLTATASWSLLTALIKKWLPGVSPSFSVSVILTIVNPFFLLTDIIMSGGLHIPQTSPQMWAIMIISGILGVGIAHTSYYRSVPVLGVALCASLDLSRPLLVALISFFLYGERLTIPQMIGGILLIAGSYLVIKIRFRYIR